MSLTNVKMLISDDFTDPDKNLMMARFLTEGHLLTQTGLDVVSLLPITKSGLRIYLKFLEAKLLDEGLQWSIVNNIVDSVKTNVEYNLLLNFRTLIGKTEDSIRRHWNPEQIKQINTYSRLRDFRYIRKKIRNYAYLNMFIILLTVTLPSYLMDKNEITTISLFIIGYLLISKIFYEKRTKENEKRYDTTGI